MKHSSLFPDTIVDLTQLKTRPITALFALSPSPQIPCVCVCVELVYDACNDAVRVRWEVCVCVCVLVEKVMLLFFIFILFLFHAYSAHILTAFPPSMTSVSNTVSNSPWATFQRITSALVVRRDAFIEYKTVKLLHTPLNTISEASGWF